MAGVHNAANTTVLSIVSKTGEESSGKLYTIIVHTIAIATTKRFCQVYGCILNLYQRKANRMAL